MILNVPIRYMVTNIISRGGMWLWDYDENYIRAAAAAAPHYEFRRDQPATLPVGTQCSKSKHGNGHEIFAEQEQRGHPPDFLQIKIRRRKNLGPLHVINMTPKLGATVNKLQNVCEFYSDTEYINCP
jgi:hypothetical protein